MTTAGPARHPTHVRSLSAPAPDIPLQPLWELDLGDAEAERISQLIDEELKVCSATDWDYLPLNPCRKNSRGEKRREKRR